MSQRDPTPTPLETVARNLLSNARQAYAPGQTLAVDASNVEGLCEAYLALLDRVARLEHEKVTLTDFIRYTAGFLYVHRVQIPDSVATILRVQVNPILQTEAPSDDR